MSSSDRILVIRLSALGDIILACRSFASIRAAFPNARIALLTQPMFATFARMMPWFDEVIIDKRPRNIKGWYELLRTVRRFAPDRVIDLQGKTRQSVLFCLLGGRLAGPQWSGAAPFAHQPRPWPPQPGESVSAFWCRQLTSADINQLPDVDMSWCDAPIDDFTLPERYVMLIPGCSPQHLHKRWPTKYYAELAIRLAAQGIGAVAVGTASESDAIAEITAIAGHVIDLSGRTTLPQVAAIARRAQFVVGNDTGPTHLAAAVGAHTLALISSHKNINPHWSAPQGRHAKWIQGRPLDALSVDEVMRALPLSSQAISND